MTERSLAWSLIGLGIVLMFSGFLGGCASVAPQTVYVDRVVTLPPPPVAPTLLHCMPEPEPLAATARQRDIAPYVIGLAQAGADCRRKLGTVAARLKEPGQ